MRHIRGPWLETPWKRSDDSNAASNFSCAFGQSSEPKACMISPSVRLPACLSVYAGTPLHAVHLPSCTAHKNACILARTPTDTHQCMPTTHRWPTQCWSQPQRTTSYFCLNPGQMLGRRAIKQRRCPILMTNPQSNPMRYTRKHLLALDPLPAQRLHTCATCTCSTITHTSTQTVCLTLSCCASSSHRPRRRTPPSKEPTSLLMPL